MTKLERQNFIVSHIKVREFLEVRGDGGEEIGKEQEEMCVLSKRYKEKIKRIVRYNTYIFFFPVDKAFRHSLLRHMIAV